MGKVPIWAQWELITASVLLCPLFIFLMAGVIGWSLLRKLWVHPRGSAPAET